MKKSTLFKTITFSTIVVMLLAACATQAAPATSTAAPVAASTTEVASTSAPADTSATTAPVTCKADSTDPIRVGLLVTLTGAFAQLGQDGEDGVKIALNEYNNEVCGRPIELYVEGTDATAQSAVDKTRTLVDKDKVQLVIGPLSGDEGQAVKDNADEWPNVTIIVAGSAAENVTMRGIKDNVFRTSYTGSQPTFALGDWAFKEGGYKHVVTVAEDYAFPYAQVGGFMKTYCADGGKVEKKFWVPIGTSDFSSIFPQIPADTDAIFVALGGTDAANFINQMEEYGKLGTLPILGGTVTVDSSTLASSAGKLMTGIVSGSIMSGDINTDAFKKLDAAFEAMRQRPPSLFVENYYRGMKFGLLALEAVNGNIEDQAAYRKALQNVSFDAPASHVSLDAYHNVVTDTFLNQVKEINGELRNSVIKTYPAVSQFWTFDAEQYQAEPQYDRDHPSCP